MSYKKAAVFEDPPFTCHRTVGFPGGRENDPAQSHTQHSTHLANHFP